MVKDQSGCLDASPGAADDPELLLPLLPPLVPLLRAPVPPLLRRLLPGLARSSGMS